MQPVQEVLEGMENRNSIPKSSRTMQENSCEACQGSKWIRVPGTDRVTRCECQKKKIAEERIRILLKDWPEYSGARLEDYEARTLSQTKAFNVIRGDPRGSPGRSPREFLEGLLQERVEPAQLHRPLRYAHDPRIVELPLEIVAEDDDGLRGILRRHRSRATSTRGCTGR